MRTTDPGAAGSPTSLNPSAAPNAAVTAECEAISFNLNGQAVSIDVSPTERLSSVLRERLNCRDVKVGCNAGDCGACSVLVDDNVVCACLTSVGQVANTSVMSLKGLAETEPLMRQLQRSFTQHGAAQCGICTPAMLVCGVSLLKRSSRPQAQDVQDALGGVLCRCTGYRKIIDAVVNYDSPECTHPELKPQLASSVGVSVPRLDAEAKVSGTDLFGDDVATPDALQLILIRSPFHHATFELGDISAWVKAHPGVLKVLSAKDIPGSNLFGVIPPFIDQPVFAIHTTRFKGEAVAAIVGDAATVSRLDCSDFPVQWVEQKALLDTETAQQSDACQLHEHAENNVLCRGLVQCGNAREALDKAHVVASGTFSTGFIEHAYIEPEAGVAYRVGDTLEVHGCTQAPYMNRDALASVMGLAPERVRIVPTAVGGGFGSKLDLSFQPYIALAAWLTGQPVRMAFTRKESMQSTTKRHPSRIQASIGVDEQGRISGFEFDGVFNTGAYASWGPTVANRVPVHASGPYYMPDYKASTTGVHTHSAPAGAFRGFGVPQAAIAQETLFDELANKIGMDRLEFRKLNALDNQQRTVTGQRFAGSVGIKACLESLTSIWQKALLDAGRFNQEAQDSGSPLRRGVGIASGWYGCGNTSLPNPSTIKAGIRRDGTVCLHQGAVDIGQGSNTVITQIFADTLGVPIESIRLLSADSAITPDAGKTSASRQTFVSGNAAKLTALAIRSAITRLTNCSDLQSLVVGDGCLMINQGSDNPISLDLTRLEEDADGFVLAAQESYDPPTKPLDANGQGEPYALYGYAAQMVILDVDILLGNVKLQRFHAAHDVGRAINPQLVEGQIHGGIAQGIGLALMEEFIPGRTENLHDYLIPTFGDVPPIDTIIVEVDDPQGPFGAKGLGEHVLIPTAPAILNAIADACDARIRHVPATPDKVYAAIDPEQVIS